MGRSPNRKRRGGKGSKRRRSPASAKRVAKGAKKKAAQSAAKPLRRRASSGADSKAEIAKLSRELSEAQQRQAATSEVLQVISSSPGDLKPVFEQMLAKAMRLCEAQCGFIYQGEEGAMRAVAEIGVPRAFAEYRRQHLHTGGAATPIDAMRATRKPAHVHDARDSEPYRSGNPNAVAGVDLGGARTVLYVPMIRNDDIVGVINLYRQEVRPFADEQIALLENFASQAVIAIQNARLFNETNEALERQTATADILKVIASSPNDVQPVFQAIAERSNQLLNGLSTAVYSLVDDMQHLMAFTPIDAAADAALKSMFPRPISETFWSEAVLKGEIFQITDAETELATLPAMRDVARLRGWRSALIVPLVRDRKPIGLISVTRVEPGSFADHHVELLRTFADQAVIAIQNTRLFNETRESLQQQTATAEVLSVIASSPTDVKPVLDAIVESACNLCEASDAYVALKEGDDLVFQTQHGSIPIAWRRRPINRQWPAGRAVADGKSVYLRDVLASEGDEFPEGREIVRQDGVRTVLTIPLMREGESIGVIILRRTEVQPFTDKQMALLKTFADQAVIAIENVRLFNETTEALARQTATAEVLKVIASSPSDLQPVFDAIAARSNELIGGHSTTVFRFVGEMAEIASFTSISEEADAVVRAAFPRPVAAMHSSDRILRGEAFETIDAQADTEPETSRNIARARGFRSRLMVPLESDDSTIGYISITRKQPGAFVDKDVELVRTFADQAVIAIQNVELFEEVQARTRDLQESLQQQTATADVLKVISASPGELDPVFQAMLENAVRLCEAQFAMLFLAEGDQFKAVARWNLPPAYREFLTKTTIPFDPRIPVVRAALTKQPVQVPDMLADQSYIERVPVIVAVVELGGARTLLQVPMLKEETLVGTVAIYRQEVRPFTEKQIALVQNFAAQAVIAIENARLLNELRQRTDDLSRSLDDLRAAQDRLVQTEKLASLGQLTAGIAHEIKNPLNFVNNFSALSVELTDELNDVLKQAELAEKIRLEVGELTQLLKSNLEKVVQHGKRADSIVKNMLLHSREGSGEQRAADINALVEESLNLAYHGARAEKSGFNITLQREFDAGAGEAELFPQEITRALLNLISNGFYAATRRKAENGDDSFEPTLLATTKNLGHAVEIRIRDNGTGIPPEVKEKMFNPFFTTKPAGEGTGLGLSMTHDIIVKQHGGSIDVTTEPGNFTEFIVVLPRANNAHGKSRGQA
jgi:GAF domain-containing protein